MNVALPSMRDELLMSSAELEWVLAAYSPSPAAAISVVGAFVSRRDPCGHA
ncbi:hypothetical protein [Streptomyces sp. NPDC002164]|uniref:hypothetical protein n=1 Tax=unclassified Streptomyces TaxID=2593676 RepID=UPI003678FB17